jgi:hypothetical protein
LEFAVESFHHPQPLSEFSVFGIESSDPFSGVSLMDRPGFDGDSFYWFPIDPLVAV